MPTPDQNLETRVAIVENEVKGIFNVFDRFEKALEKLTEVSSSLKQMLAVHENRLQERDKIEPAIFDLIEKRKEEHIQYVERVFNEIKETQREFAQSLDRKIDKLAKQQDDRIEDLETRIERLERWRWMLLGAGAVVGFLCSKFDILGKLLGA